MFLNKNAKLWGHGYNFKDDQLILDLVHEALMNVPKEVDYEKMIAYVEGEITSKWQYKIRDGKMVYRAQGIIRRITLLFDDEILVHQVEGGVEIEGLRRTAVRIIYQLNAYIEHKERY